MNLAGNSWRQAWSEWTLGLAFYRSGQFAKSEQALRNAEDAADQIEGEYRELRHSVHSLARFIRFTIRRIDEDRDAAEKLFTEAQAEMKPMPADHRQVFEGTNPYYDILGCVCK